MNKWIGMGRLTKDVEVRYSQGSAPMAIATFSIAVDRKFKRDGEPEADFFNCTAFGKQAEFCEKYLRKGTKVVVSGRFQNDTYTNKDGQKVYSTKCMVEEIEFAESKKADSESAPKEQKADKDGFVSIPEGIDEALPFN